MYTDLFDILTNRLIEESAKYVNIELVKSDTRQYKCTALNCNRKGYASGFCNAHYLRHKQGKDLNIPIRNRKKSDCCSVCGIKTNAKGGWGMCSNHYKSLRSKIIKETIVEYFGGNCMICNNKFPIYCYDLHHIVPSNKEYSLGELFNIGKISTICSEAIKCELLCANCHRIKHYGNK